MPTEAQDFAALRTLTPAEAVAYLQRRSQLTRTFAWQDLWEGEHAEQFTVSRLARLDLLQAMHEQITASVGGDLSRRDFMRDSQAMLAQAGWWGTKTVRDPATGEDVTTRFDPARLKLIYDTNTRMAYAAGQWERMARNVKTHPYMRYITLKDAKVRPAHRVWEGVTLPISDGFWNTHYPPNGWRCRCRVVSVSQREYDQGTTPTGTRMVKQAPAIVMRDWIDQRTGEIKQVPAGIDPGFGYNVGVASARARGLQDTMQDKLRKASPGLADAARNAGLAPWHVSSPKAAASAAYVRQAMQASDVAQAPDLLGPVATKAAEQAARLGISLDGLTLALDQGSITSALQASLADAALKAGEIPLTPEDLASFAHLFNRATLSAAAPANDGTAQLQGEVTIGAMRIRLVAAVRGQLIVPVTMSKRPVQ